MVTNDTSKHIDFKYHPITDDANKGVVNLEYINREHTIANILDNALLRVKHGLLHQCAAVETRCIDVGPIRT